MYKKLIIPAIILLLIVPVLINALVQLPAIPFTSVFGTGKDWFGFFGSYFGGAAGAIAAVYIAHKQVEAAKDDFQQRLDIEKQKQIREDEKQHNLIKQENRVFIGYEWEWTEWNLEKFTNLHKAKIVYTFDYQQREYSLKKDKKNITTFAKLSLLGNAKFIMDCQIKIIVKEFIPELIVNHLGAYNDPKFNDYELKIHLPIVTSEDLIFIPIINCYLKYEEKDKYYNHVIYDVERFEIEYVTPVNERIRYISNYSEGKEAYLVINDNGSEKLLFESSLQDIRWKVPGVKIVE
ncbi:hypothetical protein [Paenibacillus arenosi]|uniref:Uncharacterized protein n=1 Tax=Paenibacillus arenosi TaxID=2774142 RepID=A0ABR9B4D2_9BACL|nr:hypothetical protein [Paenibacillus arenosi]MBD8501243.1 hypothetical protein [Paenibacillus arenosi]